MALGNNSGGKTFVSVYNGTLAIRVKEGTPGAQSRILSAGVNTGKQVHELHYQFIEGMITRLLFEIKEFGQFINVEIDDKYVLSIPWKSSMKRNIVCQLPNVNFAALVHIDVFLDKKNAKKNVLLIKQGTDENGKPKKVKFAYTKESPEMPAPIETVKLGKKELDYSGVEEFLYNVYQEQIARFNAEKGIDVEPVSDEPDPADYE